MAGLLAAEEAALAPERLEHVAVADRRGDDADPCSSMRRWKPRFVITVTATSVDAEMEREHGEDLVAVDRVAALVDGEHRGRRRRRMRRRGRGPRADGLSARRARSVAPQPTLMFVAVRATPIAVTSAPSCSNASRSERRVRAVRAVDADAEPGEVGAEALDDVRRR